MYAAHYLPRLGYAKRAHLMNSMVPGLSGGKMSSSDPKSKIDFLDSPAEIKSKLKAAVCTPGQVEGNGVLDFLKAVLIPVQQLREEQGRARAPGSFVTTDAPEGTVFSISRPEKFGGDIHFKSYEDIEKAYEKEELHPGDLKGGVTDALIALLKPIQEMFEKDEEWKEAERLGYPTAATATVIASAKQGAGNKAEGKVSVLIRLAKDGALTRCIAG
jgi:tyrosyl-tRNA synthetase